MYGLQKINEMNNKNREQYLKDTAGETKAVELRMNFWIIVGVVAVVTILAFVVV